MKDYAMEKVSKIERFSNRIIDITVTMDIQKLEHRVSIVLKVDHIKIKSQASTNDMYASIDKAIQKLQSLFRKWKGKLQNYHKKPINMVDMTVNVYRRPPEEDETEEINREIEAANLKDWMPGKVIETNSRMLKSLTLDEAIMKMELSGDQFMLFRNLADKKLELVYRRRDGNYGVIKAEG